MSEPPVVQLPLAVWLRGGPSLANFEPGPNAEVLGAVRALVSGIAPRCAYLWGEPGSGKTHLLLASCRERSEARRRAVYLPLGELGTASAEVVAGLESMDLLCLDDLDAVAGDRGWEEALFHLYNRLEEVGTPMLFAARRGPAGLGLGLRDLASRLSAGAVFRLRAPDDEARLTALKVRAKECGLELPDEVGRYLLRRRRRDMHSLFAVLERLDRESLAAKRRLSVPFVRALLEDWAR